MANMKFVVVKGETGYDMTSLVESVVWSGRRGSAARSLKITLLDDEGYKHDRSGIDCEKGHQCAFYWKGQELFRGIIMNHSYSRKKLTVIAYDAGIYLSNNKDTFNYSNKTATQIFNDCMARLNMDIGTVANTAYVIPELPKPKTSYFDVICDALSLTYKSTGARFYPLAMGGKISLLARREETLKWVIETGQNLIDFTYSKSIENTRTRIRLLTEEGTVLAEKVNNTLEDAIGTFQEVDTPDDTLNAAQLDDLAASMLEEKGAPVQSFQVKALGIPDVYSGKCVYITVKELGVARTFFLDEDTHTFKGEYHSMKLKLNFTVDIATIE